MSVESFNTDLKCSLSRRVKARICPFDLTIDNISEFRKRTKTITTETVDILGSMALSRCTSVIWFHANYVICLFQEKLFLRVVRNIPKEQAWSVFINLTDYSRPFLRLNQAFHQTWDNYSSLRSNVVSTTQPSEGENNSSLVFSLRSENGITISASMWCS